MKHYRFNKVHNVNISKEYLWEHYFKKKNKAFVYDWFKWFF